MIGKFDIICDENRFGFYATIIKNKFTNKRDIEIYNLLNIEKNKYRNKLILYNGYVYLEEDAVRKETYFIKEKDCLKCIEKFIIPLYIKRFFL